MGSAEKLGLLREKDGAKHVDLAAALPTAAPEDEEPPQEDVDEEGAVAYGPKDEEPNEPVVDTAAEIPPKEALVKNRRVFISHGSNKKIVEQLKELLTFGEWDAVVSVEKEPQPNLCQRRFWATCARVARGLSTSAPSE